MLWQSEKAPLDLRGLTIAAPLSHFPKSIGQLQYLEKIVVKSEDGVPLKALPEEFCNLRSLKYLELRWCKRMISLPESFGKLTNLQHIDLLGAFTLQSLPYSFRNLTRLKHLNLSLCMSLKMSSGILGSGCPVEYLSLEYCDNVEELLSQVALQSSLETLILRRLDFKEIPSAIGGLSNLEYLWIGESIYERCNMMEEFPPSHFCLENLKTLYVESCPKLKCLHAFSEAFPQLTSLRISGCAILEYLPEDLLSLKNLRELNVHFCPLRELPLNKLDSKDKCVSGLETLNLYKVNISEVSFRVCPNLQNLYLSGCQQLRHIGELCGLAKLRQPRIGDCPNLEKLPSLETLMSLAYIEVCKCPKVKSIQGLAELTKLRVLRVYNLDELRELPGVEHVNSLEVLDVRKCPKLQWGEGVLEQLRPLMDTSYSRNSKESKRSFPRQFLECCLPFLLPWKSKG